MTEPNTEPNAVFSLEKVYIKDVSYETPAGPRAFLQTELPQIGVQLGIEHAELNPTQGVYEVVLAITVTAVREDKTVFLVEVQQGGLFRLQGVSGEMLNKTLEITCPHMLLPFAREAVSDFIGKGGFPPLLLQPVNFEALYEQKLAAQQAPAQPAQA
ncbi:MAG: protein-export chaperone SecB [Betaproteobacteria bacterium]|nr:protein-export chaperone SecB [Betaproteobacteria bacterium]